MKIFLSFCLTLLSLSAVFSQASVQFLTSKSRIKLPFNLVNNLIILPIKVNGIELNFLVDTGVEETILFSLDQNDAVSLYNVEKIMLKGLGTQAPIEGLKSYNNLLAVKGVEFLNQDIIIVLDQSFNFSSTLGIEVNGIIGYHFFSKITAKIDYQRKHIFIYNPAKWNRNKGLKDFEIFDFTLENAKPYTTVQVALDDHTFNAKCLIDSGNSEGLWLFANNQNNIQIPSRHFDDYLGRGFSGDIFGKKARTGKLSLHEFLFKEVITAFPDSVSLANVKFVEGRKGSIGGEVLKRFNVIFDYQNQQMFLKKNKYFSDKFRYNTTGITIHHVGVQWYKEEIPIREVVVSQESHYQQGTKPNLKYNFRLLPVYEILNIRPNSPAAKAGILPGDVLIKVNGAKVYRMNLDKINQLLRADPQEKLKIEVRRNEKELTFEFAIIDVL